MKNLLLDNSKSELEALIKSLGLPSYRASQLYAWLLKGVPYDGMSNLPAAFLAELSKDYTASAATIVKILRSSDGSEKYLYRLSDGETVEGVFLPNGYGNTLCVSTQAGCRMGCAFCASGKGGLSRNLTPGEILGQFIAACGETKNEKRKTKNDGDSVGGDPLGAPHPSESSLITYHSSSRPIANIVLMGSGEPLDNYDNVVKFIRLVSDPGGLKVSPRNISLSTCGIVPKIRELADENFGVTLSLSLHATTDEARAKLLPIAKKYPLKDTLSAVKYYFEKTGRRVIFEYALIKGVNTSKEDVVRLAGLAKGFPCHVNLIRLNRIKESSLAGCNPKESAEFLKVLTDLGVSASLRRSFGADIAGACGQLRAREKRVEGKYARE
ncbi:MAG: radical SAM protein [Firmicutes bacterium]|nr:radical SAM protein [Bacillota bacterium]